MDDYLAKPFTAAKLRVVLDRWLAPANSSVIAARTSLAA
jgi:hypothetical protein